MAINLEKGQRISLEKNGSLSQVFMGLGWDMVQQKSGGFLGKLFSKSEKNIDLDASCVLLDAAKNVVDIVYFGQLRSRDGSVQHTGDNLTGEGEGDDEVINVNLGAVPANVQYLVFTVSSYSGQTFDQIANAFCRLVDARTNQELARYTITGGGSFTGLILASLYRHNNEWKMRAIGESGQSTTAHDLAAMIQRCI